MLRITGFSSIPLYAGLVFLIVFSGCQKRTAKHLFPDLNPNEVNRFVLYQNDTSNLEFTRISAQNWTFTASSQKYYADTALIYKFLRTIADTRFAHRRKKDKKVLENAVNYPGTKVVIQQNDKTFSFTVQKAGSDFQSCYILKKGETDSVLCRPYLISLVNNPVRKWIKKTVFDIQSKNVSSIKISFSNNREYAWERESAGSEWKILSGKTTQLSATDITRFLKFLRSIRIHAGEIEKKNIMYGLDSPRIWVIVTDFQGNINYLKVGNRKNRSFCYSCRSDSEEGILLFSSSWMSKFREIIRDILEQDIE